MKKLVVTLDPEYIPWEPGTPTVRLRRKRNKPLLMMMSVGFAVLACVGLGVFGAVGKQRATPAPAPTLAATLALTATAAPQPTPALLDAGRRGYLAIVRGLTITFYPCAAYAVRAVGDTLAMGDTRAGPVVDITGKNNVEIQCDNTVFEL